MCEQFVNKPNIGSFQMYIWAKLLDSFYLMADKNTTSKHIHTLWLSSFPLIIRIELRTDVLIVSLIFCYFWLIKVTNRNLQ